MRILEITNYTAGGCGVGMRVLKESKLLTDRGHVVNIFSTNIEKGSGKICSGEESLGKVKIKRFNALKLGGESYMKWDFKKEAIKFNPDVIIAHSYRHLHTNQALKIAKKLGCKIFLVAHAPFNRNSSRTRIENILVKTYDLLIGRRKIKQFTKVISITKWEEYHLMKLGVKKRNILYIPNGIDESFFKPIKLIKSKPKKLIYTGRISKIKNLEVVLRALSKKRIFNFRLIGPGDLKYLNELNLTLSKLNLKNIVQIIPKFYNSKEQIRELNGSDIFILPSKSEGMPQTLVEAMARGKIVIGSNNQGNAEIIMDCKNGFTFKNNDENDLCRVLENINKMNKKELNLIQKNARKNAENFRWSKLISILDKAIHN